MSDSLKHKGFIFSVAEKDLILDLFLGSIKNAKGSY